MNKRPTSVMDRKLWKVWGYLTKILWFWFILNVSSSLFFDISSKIECRKHKSYEKTPKTSGFILKTFCFLENSWTTSKTCMFSKLLDTENLILSQLSKLSCINFQDSSSKSRNVYIFGIYRRTWISSVHFKVIHLLKPTSVFRLSITHISSTQIRLPFLRYGTHFP